MAGEPMTLPLYLAFWAGLVLFGGLVLFYMMLAKPDASPVLLIMMSAMGNCSELRGSEQPAAFQEGIETSGPPGAKEGCQGHLAVGALP